MMNQRFKIQILLAQNVNEPIDPVIIPNKSHRTAWGLQGWQL